MTDHYLNTRIIQRAKEKQIALPFYSSPKRYYDRCLALELISEEEYTLVRTRFSWWSWHYAGD